MAPNVVIQKGSILIDGKKVGTLSKDGTFQLTDANGTHRAGSVAQLIQAQVKQRATGTTSSGPSGQLRVGTKTLEVRSGTVFVDGAKKGSLSSDGTFAVEVEGERWEGNVHETPGAVWLSGAGSSGAVVINGLSFPALEGAISEAGQVIGWLDDTGGFRAVRPNGDYFEGHQRDPQAAVYLQRVD